MPPHEDENTFVDENEKKQAHEAGRYFHEADLAQLSRIDDRVRKSFIDVVQTFFGQDEALDGSPNPFRWYPDELQSKILIAARFVADHKVKNPNHSIIVGRGAVGFESFAMNNWNAPNPMNAYGKYSVLANTDIQLEVSSVQPKECGEIATLVVGALLFFRDVIRRRGEFHRVGNPIMNMTALKEAQDSEVRRAECVVSIPVIWPIVWNLSSNLRRKLQLEMEYKILDC